MRKRAAIVGIVVVAAVIGGFVGRLWAQRGVSLAESLQVFSRVVGIIINSYVEPVDSDRLVREAIKGMLNALDPYSEYLDESDFKELRIRTEAQFGGIGIHIGMVEQQLTVIAPIEGTPAARAGIRAGDRIVEIDGKSTKGFSTEDAVKLLRGEPGTKVKIAVARPGVAEPLNFELTRAIINIKSVPYAGMVAPEIAYIRLADMSRVASGDVRKALDSLFGLGASKLILDLRYNGGGLLQEGKEVADLFLGPGKLIVRTKGRVPQTNQDFVAETEDKYGDYPMVVLVNRGSASAAEIVAGALQDWERAVIVGDTTFGKGSVQTIHPLGSETGIKITTAYWYTPSGRCIHKQRETITVVLRDTTAKVKKTFHTLGKLKRTLSGEGGIAPDIYVPPEKITGLATRVPAASYFDFATEYANSHPGLTMDFVADRVILEEFKRYLRTKKNFDFTEAEFDSAQQVIAQMIEIEMGGKIDGIHGEYQMRLRRDPELQKAIEVLKPARSTEEILRRLR
ncbi:MAG: S41 family peptidase [candidate division WOR-3 bacterium]|jgi:carboxyl-terminal processing protease